MGFLAWLQSYFIESDTQTESGRSTRVSTDLANLILQAKAFTADAIAEEKRAFQRVNDTMAPVAELTSLAQKSISIGNDNYARDVVRRLLYKQRENELWRSRYATREAIADAGRALVRELEHFVVQAELLEDTLRHQPPDARHRNPDQANPAQAALLKLAALGEARYREVLGLRIAARENKDILDLLATPLPDLELELTTLKESIRSNALFDKSAASTPSSTDTDVSSLASAQQQSKMPSTSQPQPNRTEFLRVLHLSDLHIRPSTLPDIQVILRAFWSDLKNQLDSFGRPDIICFTGDIAFSGQTTEYQLAQEYFFDPLLQYVGLTREQLLWVPGNHDVDRSAVEAQRFEELGARIDLVSRDAVNRVLDTHELRSNLFTRLRNYADFTRAYFDNALQGQDPAWYTVRTLDVRGVRIGVACLNSAWRASSDGDLGLLLIGDRQLHAARHAIESADYRIALVHHPFSWLHPHEARYAENFCVREFDLVLRGHLHEPWVSQVRSPHGETAMLPAGSLFQGRALEGYSLLSLGRVSRVHLRRYIADAERFDADVLSAPGGVFEWTGTIPESLL